MRYVVYNGNRRLRDFKKLKEAISYSYEKISIVVESNGFNSNNVYIEKTVKDDGYYITCSKLPLVIFRIVEEI